MTQTQAPGVAVASAPLLTEHENVRAVDRIEAAEREAPFCPCGRHMLAVAEGDEIWLECASQLQPQQGVRGLIARITRLGHSRRLVMELPAGG